MRLLLELRHPADVHHFKNFIWEMEKRGHEVKILTTDKEMTLSLLDFYKFDYTVIGKSRSGLQKKALDMIKIDKKVHNIAKNFDPDILISHASPSLAHVGAFLKKPCIFFSDTEHAKLLWDVTKPFISHILTPSCFLKDFGPKHIRYDGYHELAYLHPNWFEPDPTILDELEISKGDKFVIIRFVSWGASHDIDIKGLGEITKSQIITQIERYAKPMITSEGELPGEFRKYQLKIPPHRIHDAMYYAHMYVGEGATMASEAAVLGTPALYLNPLRMGYTNEEHDYGLLYQYEEMNKDLKEILNDIENILQSKKSLWRERQRKLLEGKIDVTKFMLWFIENYPESVKIIKKDPDYQRKFITKYK